MIIEIGEVNLNFRNVKIDTQEVSGQYIGKVVESVVTTIINVLEEKGVKITPEYNKETTGKPNEDNS